MPTGRVCPDCGRAIPSGATVCVDCLWNRREAAADSTGGTQINRPIIVGILLVGTAILGLISAVHSFWQAQNTSFILLVDLSGFVTCCGVVSLAASLACIFGAFLSFRREKSTYVIMACAVGMLSIGPLMLGSIMSIAALIIAATSIDDYNS